MGSNREWMSLPKDKSQLREWYESGKRHPAMKMAHNAISMNRSPKKAFILLVGLTGAGKSSTVNYLFETDVAKTSHSTAETRSAIEYTVKMKSHEWGIPDLELSIIDTPGYNDTDGLEQDAKNIMSIKYFLDTHPNMVNSRPNLVMIVHNINDNRIQGKSSNFAKMLKGISNINAIDQLNPNVVVVLTHATGIARKLQTWKEKVKLKADQVRSIVQLVLKVNPEIVVQENKPEENLLDKIEDWYLLPNGDMQPKILYNACESVFNRANDEIGHEAFAVLFRPSENKNVQMQYSVSASDIKEEDYQEMHRILLQSVVMESQSEVFRCLENYRKKKKVIAIDNDILILQMRFHDLGFSRTQQLQEMTMNELIEKIYPVRMTSAMQKVLEDVLGLCHEQRGGFDCQVGKGYNIFTDSTTHCSPLIMNFNTRIRYELPENIRLKECASLKTRCEQIEDTKDYVSKRLRQLNVDVGTDINYDKFRMKVHSGYNDKSDMKRSDTQTECKLSFSVEHRIQKIEVSQPFEISEGFKSDVNKLPVKFDETDVMQWTAFFDKWGMYVVTGEYIGGSLIGDVKLKKELSDTSTMDDAAAALAMNMTVLQKDIKTDYSNENRQNTMQKKLSTFEFTSLEWNGGKKEIKNPTLESIKQTDWKAWIQSLEYFPAPLSSSLDLYPVYHLASDLNQEKATQMQIAMNYALNGKHTDELKNRDNRASTAKSNESGGCFHEDSLVMLLNRKMKRMKDLLVGDKIITSYRNGVTAQDEVIAWLHQVRDCQCTFLQIVHDHGKITLTPEHIIFVGKMRTPQHASTLKPGDELSFFTNDDEGQTVTMAIVLSIHKVEGRGIYAPLTYSGRLLVDKVDVSCYCTLNPLKVLGKDIISSHTLGHAGFLPLRMAFKFGLNISSSKLNDETGIHGYAQWLMSVILGK